MRPLAGFANVGMSQSLSPTSKQNQRVNELTWQNTCRCPPSFMLAPPRHLSSFRQAPQLNMEFMGFLRAAVHKHALGTVQTTAYIQGARLLRTSLAARQSEDCLYLNVRTTSPSVVREAGRRRGVGGSDGGAADALPRPPPSPPAPDLAGADEVGENPPPAAGGAAAAAPGAKLPVLVYIHGGDYHDGAGGRRPFYLSNALPVKGRVVLVTFNYRLGLLGHFCHPDLSKEAEAEGRPPVSGNYGILDQVSEDERAKIKHVCVFSDRKRPSQKCCMPVLGGIWVRIGDDFLGSTPSGYVRNLAAFVGVRCTGS